MSPNLRYEKTKVGYEGKSYNIRIAKRQEGEKEENWR
jgi:hypothetical protein